MIEAGLFDIWMSNAFKKMKDDRLASGLRSAQAVFEPDVSAMSIEDFQSPFVLYGFVFLLAFVALAAEGVLAGCRRREPNNNNNNNNNNGSSNSINGSIGKGGSYKGGEKGIVYY